MSTVLDTTTLKQIAQEIITDLQPTITRNVNVKGGDIASSFRNVVCMDHRMSIANLPDSIQEIFATAQKHPTNEYDFFDFRSKLFGKVGFL